MGEGPVSKENPTNKKNVLYRLISMVHTILSKEQNGIFTVRVLFLGTPITMTHTKHKNIFLVVFK